MKRLALLGFAEGLARQDITPTSMVYDRYEIGRALNDKLFDRAIFG
jgi:hypothetical protein